MRPYLHWLILLASSALLLSGCTSFVESDVIAFHAWPSELQNKTYAFERKADQENNLERQNYENLVRAELTRLGFAEVQPARTANLKVVLNYLVDATEVKVVQPVIVDPYWPYWYGAPFYGPRWRGYYGPYYDPFWYPAPVTQYREVQYKVFRQQLNIVIARARDDKNLYDVTVDSDSDHASLAFAMPYMVRSAFAEFPGPSGVPRHVKLEIKK